MNKAIYFDMDGTIADLYAVNGWLESLRKKHTKPYREAKSMIDMRLLASLINDLQALGYHVGIISWGSKVSDETYLEKVRTTKIKWLRSHLGSVTFDEIKVVEYGTPKSSVADVVGGILFDDEEKNRTAWNGKAYDEKNILEVLSGIVLKEIGFNDEDDDE